ncbi:malate synthase G [Marinomonas mediterranea]|jgi:malate synthase G|uniref:Malate synthase G n=1 Tax=Marinomonas mediterranea (strain ATCC 700492 / JCM 21426 / NBRC 103028 / MMB-1) TaxID=717774 RepID=F2JVJ8_MARM1|nr:malate synthase G [Marinomonas mediterranea]ADZ90542.1 malate synthase G [Marinomonas mediterranea MMB-1]WCN08591.1 malate synthase G [Marinomonas mediterranea]WCN12645.1 malate synthase G [Marinomonas mediterranea]WCN16719.1 malate synthase G [Marinomonas mediterranea MMB-1]
MNRIHRNGLTIAKPLYDLVNNEILPETGVMPDVFWDGFEYAIETLAPINRALLEKREAMQKQLDEYNVSRNGDADSFGDYEGFLKQIGYIVPDGPAFQISTQNVDEEIATQAAPQLVVPVKNARFALNAVNARWGSLYDALYGTDAIPEDGGAETTSEYNPIRGQKVVEFGRELLDQAAPLLIGSHADVVQYAMVDGELVATLKNGDAVQLMDPKQCIGYRGKVASPETVLLVNNALHIEIQIDRDGVIGRMDLAGVQDIVLEAAVTTIMDCEDSVAAVDAEDKVEVYQNWLGLMKGTLSDRFEKGGRTVTRSMNPDRDYLDKLGNKYSLPGRSLMFIRNVGHLMTTPAILDKGGNEVPEGIMDAFITSLAAIHDLKGNTSRKNSRAGSINIVKPKMHGPEEVAFTVTLFETVENVLGLAPNTLKVGIMDEERRTTVNLKECIRAAKERVVFINTGFLDRTGDEIHSSMHAGAFVPKTEMKKQAWIQAYEDWNVDIGLECGLPGKAQIGKGMWAMPDEMAAMLEQKGSHPLAGANTAWVPSPNGATLHATHYHNINVAERQRELRSRNRASLNDILTLPLLPKERVLSDEEVQAELDNNTQGILGYVVRWIDQGIGCSKVPDIHNIGLMEDRATLRISSQHIANWLLHGICSEEQVMDSLKRTAKIVDQQNQSDASYSDIAPSYDGIAFKAASDLIFKGVAQPSGYTEPLLHAYRLEKKAC